MVFMHTAEFGNFDPGQMLSLKTLLRIALG